MPLTNNTNKNVICFANITHIQWTYMAMELNLLKIMTTINTNLRITITRLKETTHNENAVSLGYTLHLNDRMT